MAIRNQAVAAFTFFSIYKKKQPHVADGLPTFNPNPTKNAEQISFLREKITTLRRRFQVLELQRAQKGNTADLAIMTEIEDLQRAIADDERELGRLGGRA